MSDISGLFRCPHLGLDDDPGMYCLFPNEFHLCYRSGVGKRIPPDHQESFCLQEGFAACPQNETPAPEARARWRRPLYIAASALIVVPVVGLLLLCNVRGRDPGVSDPAAVGTNTSSAPGEGRAQSGQDPRAPTPISSVLGAMFLVGPTVTPTSTATSLAAPTQAAPVAPTPTLQPNTEHGSSSELATTTPTAEPTRTHIVGPGETLWGISIRYQTTVDDLVRANGLPNRSYIYSGQRLVIP